LEFNLNLKIMKNILLGLLVLTSFYSNAQIAIDWQKCLGGSLNESIHSIQQTNDGGYVIVGLTDSNNGDVSGNHGQGDAWVVKLSNLGVLQWQKCLGGTLTEGLTSIQQITDGSYIIAGTTQSTNGDVSGYHGEDDIWVVKLSNLGVLQWQKCLGGTLNEGLSSLQQTTDGGYILSGDTNSNNGEVSGNHGGNDAWVVKISNLGVLQWQKCLGGTSDDFGYSIQQTTDGGYIVAGTILSTDGDVSGFRGGSSDAWVVKLSSLGVLQWQKCLGGNLNEELYSIQQTTDGGYIAVGYTSSTDGDVSGNHGGNDAWIVKLSSLGGLQWQKCVGGTSGDTLNSIQQTTDGGYIVAGSTSSTNGDVSGNQGAQDVLVIKLSNLGLLQWQKCLGGTSNEFGKFIQQTTDGGYIVASVTNSNNGNVSGNHGVQDAWVMKLSNTLGILEPLNSNSFSFFPNPVTNCINLKLDIKYSNQTYIIRDTLGKIITQGKISGPFTSINVEYLSGGVYFIAVGQSKNIKFIKK
jgi:hypothetical protein